MSEFWGDIGLDADYDEIFIITFEEWKENVQFWQNGVQKLYLWAPKLKMAFKCFDHWTVRFCFTLLHFSRTIHIETSKSFPPKWKSFKTQPTFLFTYFILFVFYISSSTTPFTPHNKFNSHKWLFIHCLVLLSLLLYFIFYERICFLYKYKDRIHNSIMSD